MRQRYLLLTFVFLVTTAAYTYYAASACITTPEYCFAITPRVIADNQKAPQRYRLLEDAFKSWVAPDGDMVKTILAVCVLQGVILAFALPLLYIWLKRWMNDDRAMISVMIYALVLVAAFHLWFLALAVPIEVLCMLLLLHWIDRPIWWLVPLVVVTSLTRETAVVLAGIYAAWYWPQLRTDRSKLVNALVLFGVYAGITGAIHLIKGPADHMLGWDGTLAYNISDFIRGGFFANLILSPVYYLIWRGYRIAPSPLRRLALVGIIYTVAIIGGAAWTEGQRLMLPVLILTLPMIFGSQSAEGTHQILVKAK